MRSLFRQIVLRNSDLEIENKRLNEKLIEMKGKTSDALISYTIVSRNTESISKTYERALLGLLQSSNSEVDILCLHSSLVDRDLARVTKIAEEVY